MKDKKTNKKQSHTHTGAAFSRSRSFIRHFNWIHGSRKTVDLRKHQTVDLRKKEQEETRFQLHYIFSEKGHKNVGIHGSSK